jgi:hypothetical protein
MPAGTMTVLSAKSQPLSDHFKSFASYGNFPAACNMAEHSWDVFAALQMSMVD